MSDTHPWGVPADAPPPEPRPAWGTGDHTEAPAARESGDRGEVAGVEHPDGPSGPRTDPIAVPRWTPIVDPDDVDLAAFHAGVQPAAHSLTPEPELAGAVDPHERATAEDAPAVDVDLLPESVLPGVTGDVTADASRPVDVHGDAGPLVDLASMFDDEPESVPSAAASDALGSEFDGAPVETPVADGTAAAYAPREFTSPSEALAERRRMMEERGPGATESGTPGTLTAEEAALAHRYSSASRLQDTVDRVLALAQSGNPGVQAAINSFKLTRDKAVDAEQRARYEAVMAPLMATNMVHINNPADVQTVFDIAYDELIGVGPLGPLWRDDDVTEIIVSGPDKVVCERNGQLVATPVRFRDLAHLRQTARDLAQRVDDRFLSRTNPLVTAQLPGARVQFAVAPVAPVAGVSITIRKFRPLFGLEDLLRFGALTDEMAAFLSDVVRSRATILVSGGTGSGKTTMINALSAFIPDSERVITIEDALELSLSNTHVESLLTKELASGDDQVVIGQDDLLRATLRMRPDRIIVGEIRDGKGCAVMLEAANTGHDGTLTTVHANTPSLALRRLAGLLRRVDNMSAEVAAWEVAMAFDVVVQVVRKRGRRFVSSISLVDKTTGGAVELFSGTLPPGASTPLFARVQPLRADTDLAQRLSDAGLDPTQWG